MPDPSMPPMPPPTRPPELKPSGEPVKDARRRLALLALSSGLVGALIGSLVTFAIVRGGDSTPKAAASVGSTASSRPPTVTSSPDAVIQEPNGPTAASPELTSHNAPDLPQGDADTLAVVATGSFDKGSGSIPV